MELVEIENVVRQVNAWFNSNRGQLAESCDLRRFLESWHRAGARVVDPGVGGSLSGVCATLEGILGALVREAWG